MLEVVDVEGRPAQVMERVEGPDMFSHIAANPIRVVSMARKLGEVHAELHDVQEPGHPRPCWPSARVCDLSL